MNIYEYWDFEIIDSRACSGDMLPSHGFGVEVLNIWEFGQGKVHTVGRVGA